MYWMWPVWVDEGVCSCVGGSHLAAKFGVYLCYKYCSNLNEERVNFGNGVAEI